MQIEILLFLQQDIVGNIRDIQWHHEGKDFVIIEQYNLLEELDT